MTRRVYWPYAPHPGNFGDVLTPKILDHFGIAYQQVYEDWNMICIGSIADHARPGVTVLGAGIMSRTDRPNPEADWRFVRGPRTRERILAMGGTCPEIYGDPGMLLPLLVEESAKEHDIGIVPHYIDYKEIKAQYPDHFVVDLLNENPLKVAQEITKCRKVISSSLHGLICANAYGIPAAWVRFGDRLAGDDVKFEDHYAAMGLEIHQSTMDNLVFQTGSIDLAPVIRIFQSFSNK